MTRYVLRGQDGYFDGDLSWSVPIDRAYGFVTREEAEQCRILWRREPGPQQAEVEVYDTVSVDDNAVERVLDVLAPMRPAYYISYDPRRPGPPSRCPIFEWGHETTPTEQEMRELAERIVAAVRGT